NRPAHHLTKVILDPRFVDPDHLTHHSILLVVHPFAPSVIVEGTVKSESAKDSLRYLPVDSVLAAYVHDIFPIFPSAALPTETTRRVAMGDRADGLCGGFHCENRALYSVPHNETIMQHYPSCILAFVDKG
ncbi:hypothetical protein, partial [Phyllobacterium salinisoli]|uniref:hypothetical protein n=1 Tax=Phyllobacterium salinisoli TaxID=1899321 RepID=UPI00190F8C41